jgi:hypothetical protein
MADEWDDLHGEPVDLDGDCWGSDATGDPQIDVAAYSSPSRKGQNLTGFTPSNDHRAADALAQSKRDRERRQRQRAAAAKARRDQQARNESSGERQSKKSQVQTPSVQQRQAERDEILRRSLTELQPGQHGAFFERRVKRCWWAPWKKRAVWQQVGAWHKTTPPRSGTEVVSVGSLDELEGKVRTIGKVSPSGAVEY